MPEDFDKLANEGVLAMSENERIGSASPDISSLESGNNCAPDKVEQSYASAALKAPDASWTCGSPACAASSLIDVFNVFQTVGFYGFSN